MDCVAICHVQFNDNIAAAIIEHLSFDLTIGIGAAFLAELGIHKTFFVIKDTEGQIKYDQPDCHQQNYTACGQHDPALPGRCHHKCDAQYSQNQAKRAVTLTQPDR